ncbi:hypothetical protein PEPS_05600 [Persicobacter psychrovividus]|uniref:Uncharacterized protein n=1 Tax=Persicobacter psychrovividus TaxID=387638 RepID=A0ABM7VBJ1_9BACT|nr:hypothetical protein PEPS_05600 [Persicobacter psychrovividus]
MRLRVYPNHPNFVMIRADTSVSAFMSYTCVSAEETHSVFICPQIAQIF